MYGPHFSAGFLCRRITYLESQIAILPRGSFFTRRGNQYVKFKTLEQSSYTERSINTDKGRQMACLINKHQILTNQLRFYKNMYKTYYPGGRIENLPQPTCIRPVPTQMTIEYYNHPPTIDNPYINETPYHADGNIFRSRFELIAVEAIKELGLEYKNEIPICTPSGTYFMDIVIPVYERNRCVGFEFCGRADDQKYINSQMPKILSYINVGLIPNHDVIFVLGGKDWLPDIDEIKRAIIFGIENC